MKQLVMIAALCIGGFSLAGCGCGDFSASDYCQKKMGLWGSGCPDSDHSDYCKQLRHNVFSHSSNAFSHR